MVRADTANSSIAIAGAFSQPWDGYIEGVQLYGRYLTNTELQNLTTPPPFDPIENLQAEPRNQKVRLTWDALPAGPNRIQIQRRLYWDEDAEWEFVDTIRAHRVKWTDSDFTEPDEYEYRIRAHDKDNGDNSLWTIPVHEAPDW